MFGKDRLMVATASAGLLALATLGAGCASGGGGGGGGDASAPNGQLSAGLDAVDPCKGDPTCSIPDVGYLVDATPPPPPQQADMPPPPPQPDPGDCQDWHRFGDYKVPGDDCWDPPYHYCSEGGGMVGTRYCKKDLSLCCETWSTCIPCGDEWFECWEGECTNVPLAPPDDPRCKNPDPNLIICWDNLPDHP